MTFHVGQKVVCVDASNIKKSMLTCPNRPEKGRVYTIRELFDGAMLLEELVNPPNVTWKDGSYGEAGFKSFRFRPIVERKTDISIFTEMLTPQKVVA